MELKGIDEYKEVLISVGVGIALSIHKLIIKNLNILVKEKLPTFFHSIRVNWKGNVFVKIFSRLFFPSDTKIEDMMYELLFAYDMTRVTMFYFHSPNSEMFPKVGFDKFSSYKEVRRVGVAERHSRNQDIPMESMASVFDVLFERGQIYVFCVDNMHEEHVFFHSIMKKLNINSSYNEVFKGVSGKPEIVLVMNSEGERKNVDDFSMFKNYGRIIAAEFYNVKPKR